MYNKLVVPLNRYNNFAGSLHSLDVFLGEEGATQLSARARRRASCRLSHPLLAVEQRVFLLTKAIDSEETAVSFNRHSIRNVGVEHVVRTRKRRARARTAVQKEGGLIDVGGRLGVKSVKPIKRRDLDPIKTRYLFLRSFKNVLKHKKANGHGAASPERE